MKEVSGKLYRQLNQSKEVNQCKEVSVLLYNRSTSKTEGKIKIPVNTNVTRVGLLDPIKK